MSESQASKVYLSDGDDDELQRAYRKARKTFGYFWREMTWERRRIVPGLDLACVRAPFSDGDLATQASGQPEVEQMWVGEVEFDGKYVTGVLLNSPQWLKSVKAGDTARYKMDEITDWMYVIEGQVYGGHAVNVLRSRMERAERREHDQGWGFKFSDPATVRLVPDPSAEQLAATKWFEADPNEIPEHPMSGAMATSLKDRLKQDPSLLASTDERGFTLLHQESLAGNAASVRILLEAGADRKAVTKRGATPCLLAQVLNWPYCVELLTNYKPSAKQAEKRTATSVSNRTPAEAATKTAKSLCPSCKQEYRGEGERVGQKLLCSTCAKRKRQADEDKLFEDEYSGNQESKLVWIVAGGGALAILFVGMLIYILSGGFGSKRAADQQLANAPVNPPTNSAPAEFTAPPVNSNPSPPQNPFPPRQNPVPQTLPPVESMPNGPGNPNPMPPRIGSPQFGPRQPFTPPIPPPFVPPNVNPPVFTRQGAAAPNMSSRAVKSALAGGNGGAPFQRELIGGKMIGVHWRPGQWAGENAIGEIHPIAVAGTPPPPLQQVVAPDGYAVGGIKVGGKQFVNNVQLIYMKIKEDGSLDVFDTKQSEWLGGEPKGKATTLSGDGKPAVGLHGRGLAIVDALGLLTEP